MFRVFSKTATTDGGDDRRQEERDMYHDSASEAHLSDISLLPSLIYLRFVPGRHEIARGYKSRKKFDQCRQLISEAHSRAASVFIRLV